MANDWSDRVNASTEEDLPVVLRAWAVSVETSDAETATCLRWLARHQRYPRRVGGSWKWGAERPGSITGTVRLFHSQVLLMSTWPDLLPIQLRYAVAPYEMTAFGTVFDAVARVTEVWGRERRPTDPYAPEVADIVLSPGRNLYTVLDVTGDWVVLRRELVPFGRVKFATPTQLATFRKVGDFDCYPQIGSWWRRNRARFSDDTARRVREVPTPDRTRTESVETQPVRS